MWIREEELQKWLYRYFNAFPFPRLSEVMFKYCREMLNKSSDYYEEILMKVFIPWYVSDAHNHSTFTEHLCYMADLVLGCGHKDEKL